MKSLSTLWILLKGHRLKYSFGVFFAILANFNGIFLATILMVLYDGIIVQDYDLVIQSLQYFILLIILLTSILMIGLILVRVSSTKSIFQLRVKIFEKMLHLPLKEYDKNHSGDFISRITNDLQSLNTSLSQNLVSLSGTFLSGLASMIYMLIINWKFALALFAWNLLTLILTKLFIKPLKDTSDEIHQLMSDTTKEISNILSGSYTIKLFNLEGKFFRSFSDKNKSLFNISLKKARLTGLMRGMIQFMTRFSFTGFIALGSFLAVQGKITFGEILAINQLQGSVSIFFQSLSEFLSQVQQSLSGLDRVNSLLSIEKEPKYFNKMEPAKHKGALSFDGIYFSYGTYVNTLKEISFEIKEGEKVAIIGPSGSGKSTITKLLLGIYQPTRGNISVFGKTANELSIEELRNLISYVPQEPYLFSTTIKENIAYGKNNATLSEIVAAAKVANAHDFISNLEKGYNTPVGEKGIFLSGGQRQRIAIARAIVKNSPILLLDEATSSLDNQTEEIIKNTLDKISIGKTTITVSHRMSTIRDADRIIVLNHGQIVDCGSHTELISKEGIYQKFYHLQSSEEFTQ